MTRLAFGAFGANSVEVDGLTPSTVAVVASPFTGGGPFALQVVGAALARNAKYSLTLTSDRGYYLRARAMISATPSADTLLVSTGGASPGTTAAMGLALASGSRAIRIWAGGAVRDVAGPTLAVDTAYLLELFVTYSSAGNEIVTGRVDGVQFATFTGAITAAALDAYFGVSANAAITAHFTDWAINDDQGSDNNSWCGDARTAMLLPASDDAGNSTISADAWRAGNSGTTNLFDAVNNTPPTGATSPGTTASQIVCDTPSVARNYVAVTGTYNAQINGADTINVVQGIVAHGESVSTGTKTGTIDVFANPAGSVSASFNYGADAGGCGAWPTLWTVNRTPTVIAPAPTRSSGASLRVTSAVSTRNVDACFMGVYVDYTVGLPVELLGRPFGLHGQQQLHQLLSQ